MTCTCDNAVMETSVFSKNFKPFHLQTAKRVNHGETNKQQISNVLKYDRFHTIAVFNSIMFGLHNSYCIICFSVPYTDNIMIKEACIFT